MGVRKSFRFWHRRLGVTVALFAILLSVTGVLLNHAVALRLNEIEVEADWLLSWYGVHGVSDDAVSFRVGDSWVSWANGWTFLDTKPLGRSDSRIVGAARSESLFMIISPRDIQLFTLDGDLVEHFFPAEIDSDIAAVGIAAGAPVIRAGARLYQADESAAIWTPFEGAVSWSEPAPVPNDVLEALNHHLRGDGLPLYRILLDIHSGRFFTGAGPYIMDGAALLLLVLSVTGLWIWWPRRTSNR